MIEIKKITSYEDIQDLVVKSNYIQDYTQYDSYDVYCGYEDNIPLSFFICRDATKPVGLDILCGIPQVLWFSNYGSPELKLAMMQKVREVIKSYGALSYIAFNCTDTSDAAWCASFAPMAGTLTRQGSIILFTDL